MEEPPNDSLTTCQRQSKVDKKMCRRSAMSSQKRESGMEPPLSCTPRGQLAGPVQERGFDFDGDGWREAMSCRGFHRASDNAGTSDAKRWTGVSLSLPDEWALYRRPRGTMDKLIKGAE
ncbi:hypothetical protein NPIL_218131 [Nephila pilipes]|uniref:Uncharacterized protein n=1 Tax=Nephila pilipes TaxID=299642 RepID=A0A8X6P622_NEPPI|nr:hypothetical protein NPIL_218131 [Nephila pilipes]